MNLTINMRAEALLATLTGSRERLMANLRIVVQRLGIKAQGRVKEGKLTGQVLHVRSGTLRRSINQKLIETGTGVFARVGTNVAYAAIHEYGFDGTENVRAYVRRSTTQMNVKATARVRKREGDIAVRAHTRHMVMPKRSFLMSTLQEMTPEIQTSLRSTILGTLKS